MYYARIDISEGIDPTKSNNNKEFIICPYLFYNHGFKTEDYVCNGCHDLTKLNVNISNIVIIAVKNIEAIDLLESAVFEKRGYIQKNYLNFQST